MINSNNNLNGLNSISATTISATTFYGDGSNLTGISGGGGAEITGGTYSSGTTIISNSTGGTINITGYPTKTSDLTNDGDNGVSHFISLEDLPSNIILYATTAASDIGGYSKLVTSINDPSYNTGATDVSTGSITTTAQLISSLATSSNILVGNPGVFNITTIGNIRKTAGSGDATFYFEAYKRTSGGTETLVATSDNTLPVSNGTYAEFSASGLWNDGNFVTSDRIVLKFYANRIAGGSNPTYDFQFGGSTPIRTTVPVPLNVIPASYTFTGGTVAGATNFTGGLTASTISATTYQGLPSGSFGITIDGGGSAVTTGVKGYVEMPYAGTITSWTILADQSGDAVIDLWKDTYANFPPTSADTITASARPTLSSAVKGQSSTLTGWTTAVAAGDIIAFNVVSASASTRITLALKITKS